MLVSRPTLLSLTPADQNLMAPNLTAIAEGGITSDACCQCAPRLGAWAGCAASSRCSWLPGVAFLLAPLVHFVSLCPLAAADFNFDEEQKDRMLGGVIAAAFYIVGGCSHLSGWPYPSAAITPSRQAAVQSNSWRCRDQQLRLCRLLTPRALSASISMPAA